MKIQEVNNKRSTGWILGLWVLLALVITGCTSLQIIAPWATATPTYTPSPEPTATYTPTMTPTPTMILPVGSGTPIPEANDVIDSDNVHNLVQLARIRQHNSHSEALNEARSLLAVSDMEAIQIYYLTEEGKVETIARGLFDNLVFSEDGTALLASKDEVVYLWDVQNLVLKNEYGGFTEDVELLALSPNDTLLLGVSKAKVILWDFRTGEEKCSFNSFSDDIAGVEFSYDGRLLAVQSGDRKLEILNLSDGSTIEVMDLPEEDILEFIFSPLEDKLAIRYSEEVRIWNGGEEGNQLSIHGHIDRIRLMEFSPDGNLLATGSDDGTIRFWNTGSGEQMAVQSNHEAEIWEMEFSPDGSMLASFGEDWVARIWDIEKKEERFQCRHRTAEKTYYYINEFMFTNDGNKLATIGRDGTIRVWDTQTGKFLTSQWLGSHGTLIWFTEWINDDQWLLTISTKSTQRISVWDINSRSYPVSFPERDSSTRGITLSQDGEYLGVFGSYSTGEIWKINHWDKERTLPDGDFGWAVDGAFSMDGGCYATSSRWDATVRVWDLEKGRRIALLDDFNDVVNGVLYTPDGKWLITGSQDGTLKFWEADNDYVHSGTFVFDEGVKNISISADGSLLAVGLADGMVKILVLPERKELAAFEADFEGIYKVRISPDGRFLAALDYEDRIVFWDLDSQEEMYEVEEENGVWSIVFSMDSEFVALGYHDGRIKLLDVTEGVELFSEKGHAQSVRGIEFSPDGTRMYTGSWDGSIGVWGIRPW